MSRVVASTEYGYPYSLVRGFAPKTPAANAMFVMNKWMKGGRSVRKRPISFLLRLSESEYAHLMKQVEKTKLPRETYIRALIEGYTPKEMPPIDYFVMIRELHAIGNNLNQLAAKAHATGHLERAVFQEEADRLRRAVQQLQQAMIEPERRKE